MERPPISSLQLQTRKLIRKSFILLSADGVASLALFLEMIIMARLMGLERFGIYSIIVAYSQTVFLIINVTTWDMFFHYFGKYRSNHCQEKSIAVVKLSYFATHSTALAALLAMWLLSHLFGPLTGEDYLIEYSFLAGLPLLFNTTETFASVFFRQFDNLVPYSLVLVTRAITELIAVSLVLQLNSSVDYSVIFVIRAVIVAGGMLALLFLGFRTMNRHFDSSWRPVPLNMLRGKFSELITFALHSHGATFWTNIYRSSDVLIVGAMLSETTAGIYRIAKVISRIAMKLILPIYNSVFPQLIELWHTYSNVEFKRYLIRISSLMASIFFPVLIVLHWLCQAGLPFLAGDQFSPVIIPAQILIWAQLPLAVFVWQKPLIIAAGKPKIYHGTTIVAAAVSLLLLFMLIPPYGAAGAALAVALFPVLLVGMNLVYIFSKRIIEHKPGRLEQP